MPRRRKLRLIPPNPVADDAVEIPDFYEYLKTTPAVDYTDCAKDLPEFGYSEGDRLYFDAHKVPKSGDLIVTYKKGEEVYTLAIYEPALRTVTSANVEEIRTVEIVGVVVWEVRRRKAA